jgi:hypothetical protein
MNAEAFETYGKPSHADALVPMLRVTLMLAVAFDRRYDQMTADALLLMDALALIKAVALRVTELGTVTLTDALALVDSEPKETINALACEVILPAMTALALRVTVPLTEI